MQHRTPQPDELARLEQYHLPLPQLCDAVLMEWEVGEYLCRDGEVLDRLFFVLRGRIRVFVQADTGSELTIAYYQDSGIVGDLELLLGEAHCSATCLALEPVTCIALPRSRNSAALLANAAFLRTCGSGIARAVLLNRNQQRNVLYPLEVRLCSYIALTETGGLWHSNLSDVAELLGTSYRHLTRCLQGLCAKGVLQKQGRGYQIADRAAFSTYDKGFDSPIK